MIDSHCHLADDAFASDLEAVVARAREAGLSGALCILSAEDDGELQASARVRDAWSAVRFAAGVHPHHAGVFAGRVAAVAAAVATAVERTGAGAIGEIGLDYHYDFSPRPVQQEVFAAQLALAVQRRLPVIIHTREATDDTFALLRAEPGVRGVFHCFTGDVAMARLALDVGFYISLAGIVTFPKAESLREVARFVPDDRLLIETDSPYLAPVPMRGKRNEPGFVPHVLAAVANARGAAPLELAARTSRNFETFLGPTVSQQTA
jgi:TatD DNase family protein